MNWQAPSVVIQAATDECRAEALALSQTFGIPMASNADSADAWRLTLAPESLQLVRPDGLSTSIDFMHGKAVQRSRENTFASQPLARALGLQKLRKQNPIPSVIDATAGFGTDAWMMASLGCEVRMLEASPVLGAMLTQALTLAQLSGQQNEDSVAHRLTLINENAVAYLNNEKNPSATIVYLDPMYPQTRSKALVKKGMQLLHDLVGPDNNGEALLTAALSSASYRVVVKRPKGAIQLEGSENWSGQITQVSSAHTRFDIYHVGTA